MSREEDFDRDLGAFTALAKELREAFTLDLADRVAEFREALAKEIEADMITGKVDPTTEESGQDAHNRACRYHAHLARNLDPSWEVYRPGHGGSS